MVDLLFADFHLKGFVGSTLALKRTDGKSLQCRVDGLSIGGPARPDRPLDFWVRTILDDRCIEAEVFLVEE